MELLCYTFRIIFVCDVDYPDQVPGSCGSPFFFDCGNGFCIPFRLVRNCIDDCGNGADEGLSKNHPYCQLGAYTRKGVPIFRCATTANCVPFDWLNDGHNDCGDWSDEDPCLDGFFCVVKTITLNQQFTICECINRYSSRGKAWLKPDPLLLRIPGQCYAKTLKFDCGDGTCIDIRRFRDCVVDCLDGSDEEP
ncbi:Ldl recept a domain containing protein [Trichuris trichiura]|uniref:Ldl recept a domain containing protein n=1 Tax=Trichuris trichiura TaxID=36087 RepID=A0A077ZBX8_TRITR|nr:Ldl recept a domain containing protein [Trichuris trichiura]